jgi:non-heme chloroperoxidase
MRIVFSFAAGLVLVMFAAVAGAIAFDSPAAPPPMASVSRPFKDVDFSDLPPVTHYLARDGAQLAYRRYAGDPERQLEDDLEDLLTDLDRRHHAAETTLIGFSSGGGFALRVAGGRLGSRFSRFILLSPFLRHDAPNSRSDTAAGWTSVAVPRIVGLQLATRLGITSFNGLPVLAFAVAAGNPNHLTPSYSYRLLTNFSPDDDYIGDLRRAQEPLMAVAGTDDEIFQTDRLQAALAVGKPGVRVDLVPGVGHIELTTTPTGTTAIVQAWHSKF